jgi:hypothetical protein
MTQRNPGAPQGMSWSAWNDARRAFHHGPSARTAATYLNTATMMAAEFSDPAEEDLYFDPARLEEVQLEVAPYLRRRNPANVDEAAVEKYREFHRFDPKKIIQCKGLTIPSRLRRAGDAKHVMYRSHKVDPATMQKPRGTFDYIHEHDAGVRTYLPDGELDTDVPGKFRPDPSSDPALVVLGKCLGFAFTDPDGELVEAEGRAPLPDLCCTPDGKCLYVVQNGKKVLAMMWGGALGVFARGIDG